MVWTEKRWRPEGRRYGFKIPTRQNRVWGTHANTSRAERGRGEPRRYKIKRSEQRNTHSQEWLCHHVEQRSEGQNTHKKRNGALKGAATIRRTEGTIFRRLPGISDIVPLQARRWRREVAARYRCAPLGLGPLGLILFLSPMLPQAGRPRE